MELPSGVERKRNRGEEGERGRREREGRQTRETETQRDFAATQSCREAVLPRSTHAVSRPDKNVPSFAFSLDVDFPKVTQFL